MIFSVIVFLVAVLIVFTFIIVGLIFWASECLNIDVDSLFEQSLEKSLFLIKEKETEETRLLVFQIKNKGKLSSKGKACCDKIFQASSREITFVELKGNNIIIFLLRFNNRGYFSDVFPNESKLLVETVSLLVPEDLLHRAKNLYLASKIFSIMFEVLFKVNSIIKGP